MNNCELVCHVCSGGLIPLSIRGLWAEFALWICIDVFGLLQPLRLLGFSLKREEISQINSKQNSEM